MSNESRFFGKKESSASADDGQGLMLDRTLAVSKTGFFRLLIGKHFGRKVVIKTLKEECAADPVARMQLEKEFRVLFPLSSANVAQAFRLTAIGGDVPAIEMEWCDGSDVRGLINGSLTAEDAIAIIRGVLQGLEDIHRAGVVHRDIKPENVMFDPFRKVVKIIDFGCAYVIGGTALQGPGGTERYTPVGKMSAESEPEPKDDLYALGVMVGEMSDALKATGKESSLGKKLGRFAVKLRAGRYSNAAQAAADFEKILRRRNTWLMAAIAAICAVLIALFIILYRETPDKAIPEVEEKPAEAVVRPDSSVIAQIPAVEVSKPVEVKEESSPPVTAESVEITEAVAVEDVSDSELYQLAMMAGAMMREGSNPDAPLRTRMDAYIMNFCDSVYIADELYLNFPPHMQDEDMRSEAIKYGDEYDAKLNRELARRYGRDENPHRSSTLLKGRFYAKFRTYHYNPYY